MKLKFYYAILIFIVSNFLSSCDKINNPYLPQYVDIDTTLLDGIDLVAYKNNYWPTFTQNTNTLRNVLIEDYTGHKCSNCPEAGNELKSIIENNSTRVFGVGIHIGAKGIVTSFQTTSGLFSNDFTTPEGIEISKQISDGGFFGNPSGTVNRKKVNSQIFQNYSSWNTIASSILTENDLKVNIQGKVNYFQATRGIFLHTETELLTSVSDDLYQVVYLVEDSIISPQAVPKSWNFTDPKDIDVNYVHRDVHRGNLDGKAMGRKLDDNAKIDKDGNKLDGNKYYLNYSYQLPEKFNPENMHLLIYVYNKNTLEIYQVIKQKIIP